MGEGMREPMVTPTRPLLKHVPFQFYGCKLTVSFYSFKRCLPDISSLCSSLSPMSFSSSLRGPAYDTETNNMNAAFLRVGLCRLSICFSITCATFRSPLASQAIYPYHSPPLSLPILTLLPPSSLQTNQHKGFWSETQAEQLTSLHLPRWAVMSLSWSALTFVTGPTPSLTANLQRP